MAFVEVSKAEFFGIIGPRNVHPRPERNCSIWEDVSTREVIGRTEPGYIRRLGRPDRYWIADKYAAPQPVAKGAAAMSDVQRYIVPKMQAWPEPDQQTSAMPHEQIMVLASEYSKLEAENQALKAELEAQRAGTVVTPDVANDRRKSAHYCRGWNACLDELARLNGKTVSMADIRDCLDAELREWTGDHRKAVEVALTDSAVRISALLDEGEECGDD